MVDALSIRGTFQTVNAFKGCIQRWAIQAQHTNGRDWHATVVKLGT
jgi:hypothetical protein